jgi:hypothetical protein
MASKSKEILDWLAKNRKHWNWIIPNIEKTSIKQIYASSSEKQKNRNLYYHSYFGGEKPTTK